MMSLKELLEDRRKDLVQDLNEWEDLVSNTNYVISENGDKLIHDQIEAIADQILDIDKCIRLTEAKGRMENARKLLGKPRLNVVTPDMLENKLKALNKPLLESRTLKFSVGDVLVDSNLESEEQSMSALVEGIVKDGITGQETYIVRYSNGEVDRLAPDDEVDWQKAPVGSVGWLVHVLGNLNPMETVFYLDNGLWERIEEVSGRASGGVFIC